MLKINSRIALAFTHDVLAAVAAWCGSYWIRFNLEVPPEYTSQLQESLLLIVPLQAAVFWYLGLYRGIWRFASIPDLKRILIAVAITSLAIPALIFMLQLPVPRSVLLLNPVLLAMMMSGSRIAYRMWRERDQHAVPNGQREPVIVIGADEAAVNLLKELARSTQWRVAAVFDDDPARIGRQLQGVQVLAAVKDLPAHLARLGARHAIIAMPAATHTARRRAVDICSKAGLKVMTVPSYDDLVSGKVTVSQIRHIELDDLLGRDPVVLDTSGLKDWIENRTIMVTGAGGSIGSELCRQVARFNPARLVLFELSELALYTLEQEFQRRFPSITLTCAIGDVKDAVRVTQVMAEHKPSVLFHAAAYKHVPLMETENPWQAIRNNVSGTHVVATAAIASNVEKFVLISTDKAVNPTNVMGASKRLAELVCQTLQTATGTRFVMVRFGNVLGSTGSVIPKFREQIAAGGPVTVTHPEIRRYFMSIPEAAQLVMQAGLMGRGGEIFVLDMGEPVLIADLARDLIRLSGFNENEIKISFTGLRPGEKLYEELLSDNETTLPTPHPKLRIAQATQENAEWLSRLLAWLSPPQPPSDDAVRRDLARWVPEYHSQ